MYVSGNNIPYKIDVLFWVWLSWQAVEAISLLEVNLYLTGA
jgi:hypothetical protein